MLTLLKIFFLPRLKSVSWQMMAANFAFVLALYLGNFQMALICAVGAFYVILINLMSVNLSNNLEWMRNSVYSPKKLLRYYFFEQTLMFIWVAILSVGSIVCCILLGHSLGAKMPQAPSVDTPVVQNSLDSLAGAIVGSDYLYFKDSMAETSLEILFGVILTLSFIYGAEIIKTYFMNLKYEKKFSNEERYFQALMFIIMFFIMTMDRFDFVNQFKIILLPFIVSLNIFAFLYATNQSFKLCRFNKKSPLVYVPVAVFLVLFSTSYSFSLFNFKITDAADAKISEHRFLGVLAPELSDEFVLKAYQSDLTSGSISYLMENYPLDSEHPDFFKIVNHQPIISKILLSQMWNLEKISPERKDFFLKKINEDFTALDSDRYKKRAKEVFLEVNKDFFDKHPEYQNLAMANFTEKKKQRLPASQNETISEASQNSSDKSL